MTIGALVFCVGVTQVGLALAAVLVARRALEWIAELELSERELAGDVLAAQRAMMTQAVLFVGTIAAVVAAPRFAHWAALPWALSPALLITRRFLASPARPRRFEGAARVFPHFGSTAVTGVSIYIFRAMLVLLAGKALAGDLFVAFAIARFAGTLFANVLGPTMSLYEQRTGRAYFPSAIRSINLACVSAGALILIAAWMWPQSFAASGKALPFWHA